MDFDLYTYRSPDGKLQILERADRPASSRSGSMAAIQGSHQRTSSARSWMNERNR